MVRKRNSFISRQRLRRIALAALLGLMPALSLAPSAESSGSASEVVWTTRGDFENNAATVGSPTSRNMVNISGAAPGDDAGVRLARFVTAPVAAGEYHTLGLKNNGTVVAAGGNATGQGNVSSWSNIVSVAAGGWHSLGLKSDGTVVGAGSNTYGQINVSSWSDVVSVAAGRNHSVGLRSDGTVVEVGYAIQEWPINLRNIVAVAAASDYTVGLRSDGTVIARGHTSIDEPDVSSWSNIVAIAAGAGFTLGLKSDGTVVGAGSNSYGQINVSSWSNIVSVAAGGWHSLGLKGDGTVVAAGSYAAGESDVSSWSDIVAVAAGFDFTVGLRSDGTAVATGKNTYGQTAVSSWSGLETATNTKYSRSGTLSNLKIDAEEVAFWDGISWNGTTPPGTSIKMRTRGAETEAGLASAPWSDHYTASGSGISTPPSRWLEVEARLETADSTLTPVLDDLDIDYVVDDNAPAVTDIQPSGTLYTDSTRVSARFSDPAPSSGIDSGSASLTVSGGTVSDCTTSESGISCSVSGLRTGEHVVNVSVSDRAGNRGSNSGSFVRAPYAVWTSKGDFEANAATVGSPASRGMVTVSGVDPGDDARVRLANFGSTSIAGTWDRTVGIKSDGTLAAAGDNSYGQIDFSGWNEIIAVSAGRSHTAGLRRDGTVLAAGTNAFGEKNVGTWSGIVAVAAGGYHTAGLRNDGTVMATGYNGGGQTGVSPWSSIVAVAAGHAHTVGLKSDGTVMAAGNNYDGQTDVSSWRDIVAVAAGDWHTVGLKSDGTVVAAGSSYDNQTDVSSWRGVVAIAASGGHTAGLKSDGTVVVAGADYYGETDVSSWSGIVAVASGGCHTIGLKSDGTLVVAGNNDFGQAELSSWSGIDPKYRHSQAGNLSKLKMTAEQGAAWKEISWNGTTPPGTSIKMRTRGAETEAGLASAPWSDHYTASGSGISTPPSRWLEVEARLETADPSVTPALDDLKVSFKSFETWTTKGDFESNAATVGNASDRNMIKISGSAPGDDAGIRLANFGSAAIAAGAYNTVGLRSDGTVVATGYGYDGQTDVSSWNGVVAVAAGPYHTLGLKGDGTVIAAGYNGDGQTDLSSWNGIVAVAAGGLHSVGLRSDGTVVAAGGNAYGQTNASSWSNIVAIAATANRTVGLKSDGTVVTAGDFAGDSYHEDASSWSNIVAIAVGYSHIVGLKDDGTVVGVGENAFNQVDLSAWNDIVVIAAGGYHTLGLKSDGTVIAAGRNGAGQNDVSSWSGIQALAGGWAHSAGLKSNGTVVAAGDNGDGQTNVSSWSGMAPRYRHSWSGVLSNLRMGSEEEATWDEISWNGSTPPGTSIKMRTRSADTEAGLYSAPWSEYYTASGSQISHAPSKWLEVEAMLETADSAITPVLDDVTVTYGDPPFCTVAKPDLALSILDVYWTSYADYMERQLSVKVQMGNTGADTALDVAIAGASATNGVLLSSRTPILLGDIPADGSALTDIKYEVPAGVQWFRTTIMGSASDAWSCSHTYP